MERGNRFVARVSDGNGGLRDKSFGFHDGASKEKARAKAEKFLNTTIVLRDTGKLDPKESRLRIDGVAKAYIDKIRVTKKDRSIEWIEAVWRKHLEPFFGGRLASRINLDLIEEYRQHRLADVVDDERKRLARHSTINKECTILKAMLNQALEAGKIHRMPRFPDKLRENAPREGFIGDDAYDTLVGVCDEPWLKAFVAIAYNYGMRKGELLGLTVGRIDMQNRMIILPRGTTKSGEGRAVVMTDEVLKFIEPLVKGRSNDDPLFVWTKGVKSGKAVKDFRGSWNKAKAAAGLPADLLIHDFRRSAIRNLELGGVSRDTAMQISGHSTDSVYRTYNIQDYTNLIQAAKQIEKRRMKSGANQVQNLEGETKSIVNG